MSEQDKTSSDKVWAARNAGLRQMVEAARSEESFAEYLRASGLEPFDSLDSRSRELLERGHEVEHSPIIITDGSVRMNLSSEHYTLTASLYTSTDLVLQQVESTVGSHDNGTNICYTVRNSNEVCTIVFHCRPEGGGANENNIVIQGGPMMSPIISFDPGEFSAVMNPPPLRKVHNNAGRRIVGMEVFSTLNGVTRREHVCPLAGDGCEYQITDPHRHP